MSAKADPIVEIQDIFLQKDEIANMVLDNVFAVVDEQIDLAEARIRRGERPALVFASTPIHHGDAAAQRLIARVGPAPSVRPLYPWTAPRN